MKMGVAEASKDVKDRSESSPSSVADLNEYVGAAWYEDTLAEDESSASNRTDSSELDSELINLNEFIWGITYIQIPDTEKGGELTWSGENQESCRGTVCKNRSKP